MWEQCSSSGRGEKRTVVLVLTLLAPAGDARGEKGRRMNGDLQRGNLASAEESLVLFSPVQEPVEHGPMAMKSCWVVLGHAGVLVLESFR